MVIVCFTFYLFSFLLSQKMQRVHKRRRCFSFSRFELNATSSVFPSPKPSVIHQYAPLPSFAIRRLSFAILPSVICRPIIHHLSFAVHHSPSNHPPFTVRHSSFAIHHSPSVINH